MNAAEVTYNLNYTEFVRFVLEIVYCMAHKDPLTGGSLLVILTNILQNGQQFAIFGFGYFNV